MYLTNLLKQLKNIWDVQEDSGRFLEIPGLDFNDALYRFKQNNCVVGEQLWKQQIPIKPDLPDWLEETPSANSLKQNVL